MSNVSIRLAAVVEILRNAGLQVEVHGPEDVSLSGVSQDSRTTRHGDLFVAWKGVDSDAHDYLLDAAGAGASAAIVERPVPEAPIPQIAVNDGRLAGAIAADCIHGSPWRELFTCGITGTNGKTTTALLARHILELRGAAAAIGTLGIVGTDGSVRPGTEGLTTPGPVAFSGWLRRLADEEVRSVTVEASSHALEQRRLDGTRFDVAAFTNLGIDHLDYHGGAGEYLRSKARLVELLDSPGVCVVNADDETWRRHFGIAGEERATGAGRERGTEGSSAGTGGSGIGEAAARGRILTFGIDHEADLEAVDLELLAEGADFTLRHEGKDVRVCLPLLGRFNVENALAAAAVGLAAGLSLEEIARRLESAPQIPGRLEIVARGRFTVVIDFAHTADALERVLATVRPFAHARLIVLFGAGGDRDRSKRPEMGRVVASGADLAIVTSDNPRTEDPERIIDDIAAGMPSHGFERIVDRREAIERAFALAAEGDFVLLAGKGHERHQSIGGRRIPFDERAIVRDLLGRAA